MVSLDKFEYTPYNTDFGPLTLHDLVELERRLVGKRRLHTVLQVSPSPKQKARGICLLACYLHYSRGYSVAKIVNLFGESTLKLLTPFRDAGIGPADYPISVVDVLRGLSIGMSFDWV